MLRRPPTAIHLTPDDLSGYDISRARRLAVAATAASASSAHRPVRTTSVAPAAAFSTAGPLHASTHLNKHTRPNTHAHAHVHPQAQQQAHTHTTGPSTPGTTTTPHDAHEEEDADTFASSSLAPPPSPSPTRRRLFGAPPASTTTATTGVPLPPPLPLLQSQGRRSADPDAIADIPLMRARLAAASAAAEQMEAPAAMAGRRAGVVGMPAAEARDMTMMVAGGFGGLGLDGADEDEQRSGTTGMSVVGVRARARAGLLPVTPADGGERNVGAVRDGAAAAAEAPARAPIGVRERRRMVAARATGPSDTAVVPPAGPAGQGQTQTSAGWRARDERIFGPSTAAGR